MLLDAAGCFWMFLAQLNMVDMHQAAMGKTCCVFQSQRVVSRVGEISRVLGGQKVPAVSV